MKYLISLKYVGYWRGLVSVVYNFFDKMSAGCAIKSEIMPNQELSEELHEPIIRQLKRPKIYSSSRDNLWGADLALVDIQLISEDTMIQVFYFCYVSLIFIANMLVLFL